MPGEGRQSAAIVEVFGEGDALVGVVFGPGIRLVDACSIHEVEAYECRIFAGSQPDGLHIGMLGDVAVGRPHVAGHDARDGLLAEVVVEEGIDGLGSVGGIGIRRCRGDVELHGTLAVGYGDVVDAEPGPAGCKHNRIVALIHKVGADNGLAWTFLCRVEGGSVAIDRQINHLVAIQSVVANGDSFINNSMAYYPIFLFFFLTSIISPKLISPEYNNGNVQDPKLDKSYLEKKGQNLYYLSRDIDNTMFNIALNPNETLEVNFKVYTDSETLSEALDNGYKIYFGFDFNVENMNKSLKQYKTDIMICVVDKKDAKCYDYVYDTEKKNYLRNDDGRISPNQMIALGFENITLNLLNKNIIGYKNYYGIKFNKKFTKNYQNETLYIWVNYMPNDIVHEVTGFYGVIWEDDDLIEFPQQFPIYYDQILFENGSGLKRDEFRNNMLHFLNFVKYGLIFYFTFLVW